MPWSLLAFAGGVLLLQQLAVLPTPTFLGLGLLAGMGLVASGRQSLRWAGAFLLGLAWAGGMAHWRLADALPTEWEGREIEVEGVITDLPQGFERGTRFTFAVARADAPVPSRIALAWYRPAPEEDEVGDVETATTTGLPLPKAGERWRFVVRLKRPHGSVNPHGFDYEGWLFERGIRATGYVRKSALTARLGREEGIAAAIGQMREAVRLRLGRTLPDHAYAGVLAALAIGDQQAISPELWRLFAATGITHLMSISGLHVTMVGALLAWLANFLWRRSIRLPLRWPAQKVAAVAGLAGAFAYALLAGFGVPAQRTLVMLAVATAALLSGRAIAAPRVLGTALVLVLLADPWAVLSAGFWLSFGAVALLFYIVTGGLPRHWLIEWLRAQWAITLGLIPLLLALFQQFSLVSPLANALAIPLVSLLVTPLALLGSLPGMSWALSLAHALLVPLIDFLAWLGSGPGVLWQQHAPPAWAVVLGLLGVLWLLLPRGFPVRWLGAVLCLPLLLVFPPRPGSGELWLTVLDVGQGQAVHIQTATHDLMFDAGPDFGGAADAGSRILVPYLRAVGVNRLDRLIVSHADRDHAGGMDSLQAAVPIGELLTSIEKSALAGRRCEDGESWEWDGVRFRLLHPVVSDYAARRSTNAMSCVLQIETAHGGVLIPGDIEGAAEAELLARHGAALQSGVLVAPHHGGKRTSSPAFILAVVPREVVFSAGYRNRFGHPVDAVVERYRTAGALIHRTDQAGAVRVRLGPEGTVVTHERERQRRYWQAMPE